MLRSLVISMRVISIATMGNNNVQFFTIRKTEFSVFQIQMIEIFHRMQDREGEYCDAVGICFAYL